MTAGTGHRRAAEALVEAVRRRCPGAEVLCVDCLAWVPGWLQRIYPGIYRCLVGSLPTVWAIAYHVLDHPWAFALVRHGRWVWNRTVTGRLRRLAGSWQPDVVIATHFFPAEVFGHERQAGRLAARVIVVITDLFPHRLWLAPGVEAFVVGSPQTKQRALERGIEASRLHPLGIPIGSQFGIPQDRQRLIEQLGLDPRRRTALIVSGGMGLGPVAGLVHRLVEEERARPGMLQLVVVCGQNARLARRLRARYASSPMPVAVLEFVETMPELMAASDLLVTKAGGLTLMEALARALPMVLCGVIPGQERFNAEYVARHGAAILTGSVEEALEAVRRLRDQPEELEAMRRQALALARPQAAEDIISQLVCRSP